MKVRQPIPVARPSFGEAEAQAAVRAIQSGWVVQGPNVAAFEDKFAEFVGVGHAVAMSSCTTALHAAVMALGLRPGDEVIVPSFTWVATANVVEQVGARPVFCDIRRDTFNIDPDLLPGLISSKTVGVIPVHLFGLAADLDPIMSLARARGLWVLEDAACALGATVNGKHVGTFGDIGCFSFHPRKSITTGEGGMAVTSDDATDATLRSLRDHGSASNPSGGLMPDFPILGFNYRMTDIQGAIGSVQMDRASELVNERRRIASKYDTGLAGLDWIQLPTVPADYEHGFQSYVIAVTGEGRSFDEVSSNQVTRDRFVDTLGGAGIGCRPGTHAPPLTSYYRRRYGYEARDYPNASYAEASTAALPVYPGLLDEEIDYVIDVVRSFEPVGQV